VLEALNNVAKYSEKTRGKVGMTQTDGELRFAVVDGSVGFDTGATSYGTGLQGMAYRLDAIGGVLPGPLLLSRRGERTTIEGRVPAGVVSQDAAPDPPVVPAAEALGYPWPTSAGSSGDRAADF
jgi:signal transduction histidine kinase